MYTWLNTVDEGSAYKVYIPSKNITYTIVALNGPIANFPPELLREGAAELLDNEKIVVKIPGVDEKFDPEELKAVSIQNINYSNQIEEVEISRLTIPLNNCGGSARLSQLYSYTQTFIYEYTTESGYKVGAEIPISVWVKLLGTAQMKYGILNGQVDTKTIEYNMAADPGTFVIYHVIWKEIWETGSGHATISTSAISVPFRVKTNVIYEVISEAGSCP
jgi:hypothetical protein